MMLERDARILLGNFDDRGAPELRHFEHIGLIDRSYFLAPLPGQLEGNVGNPGDFVSGIAHGVPRRSALPVPGSRLAKVQAAQQLADKQNVGAFGHFGAQRGVARQRRVGNGGPQIGKPAQSLAELQKSRFGPAIRGQGIEFVAAHRSQQHGVTFQSGVECRRRQGRAGLADGVSRRWASR